MHLNFWQHAFKTLGLTAIGLVIFCSVVSNSLAYQESPVRYALVIGNQAYPTAPLANPVNDARAVADKLSKQDFEVTTLLDVGSLELVQAISSFYQKIESAETSKRVVALVFYAGHAVQINHRNYLVPVSLEFFEAEQFFNGLFDVNKLLDAIPDIPKMQNIIVLDACRDNPFENLGAINGDLKIEDGLAPMRAPVGTLIAYSTEPGSVASDGSGENGLYTSYLLEHMGDKITIEEVFKKVRLDVARESDNGQIPWEHSSLFEDVFINSPPNREVPELMSF